MSSVESIGSMDRSGGVRMAYMSLYSQLSDGSVFLYTLSQRCTSFFFEYPATRRRRMSSQDLNSNPWSSPLEQLLGYAQQLGYSVSSTSTTSSSSSVRSPAMDEASSERAFMIEMMEDLVAAKQELLHLQSHAEMLSLSSKYSTFTQLPSLDRLTRIVQSAMDHIHEIISAKSEIITTLQTPLTDDALTIEWEFRDSFIKAMQQAAHIVESFREVIGVVEFDRSVTIPSVVVNSNLIGLRDSLVRMQQLTQTAQQQVIAFQRLSTERKTEKIGQKR